MLSSVDMHTEEKALRHYIEFTRAALQEQYVTVSNWTGEVIKGRDRDGFKTIRFELCLLQSYGPVLGQGCSHPGFAGKEPACRPAHMAISRAWVLTGYWSEMFSQVLLSSSQMAAGFPQMKERTPKTESTVFAKTVSEMAFLNFSSYAVPKKPVKSLPHSKGRDYRLPRTIK